MEGKSHSRPLKKKRKLFACSVDKVARSLFFAQRIAERGMIIILFLWIILDQILKELHKSSLFAFLFLFARLVGGTLSRLLDLVKRLSCVLLCRTCQPSLVTWDRTGLEEGRWNLL